MVRGPFGCAIRKLASLDWRASSASAASRGLRLATVSLLALACGCSPYRLVATTPLEVIGFDDGEGRYVVGLAPRELLGKSRFQVTLRNLPIEDVAGQKPQGVGFPEPSCLSKLTIRRGTLKGTVSVTGVFGSPFSYGPSAELDRALAAWVTDCDCASIAEEGARESFQDRLVDEINARLASTEHFSGKALSQEARVRVELEVPPPFASYDSLLRRERGLVKQGDGSSYFTQLLRPGEWLCFQTSSHAIEYDGNAGVIFSTNEPGAVVPRLWQTVGGWGSNRSSTLSTGFDPLGRTVTWADEVTDRSVTAQADTAHEYLSTPDAVAQGDNSAYPFALLVTQNQRRILAEGPTYDLTVLEGDTKLNPGVTRRDSFLILVSDFGLLEHLLQRLAESPFACGDPPLTLDEQAGGEYIRCLVSEWAERESREETGLIRDVLLPVNSRPYVAFEVELNGKRELVRSGETLLGLIDRLTGLSARVYGIRSTAFSAPTRTEAQLVRNAVENVSFFRRAFGGRAVVGLGHAQRLEDLMIPLRTGDVVTCR